MWSYRRHFFYKCNMLYIIFVNVVSYFPYCYNNRNEYAAICRKIDNICDLTIDYNHNSHINEYN